MESDNLRTASLYINNQLLSRGLLRNGQTIEFARPDKGEGGMDATMGRVMGIVNDLILRRDVSLTTYTHMDLFKGATLRWIEIQLVLTSVLQRDAQQRETLAQTIRTLRADTLRQTADLERLTTKHAEAQRRLGLAEATERALKTQLRSAEQAARGLKEEMGRMRLLVGQTRAQCANDVRKRERVIEGMKKHVGEAGRSRGSGKTPGVATITVVAGVGAEVGNAGAIGTDDTGYDLRMETNEFLTELARGLSEENEHLGGLVRTTVETLRTLSGYEKEEEQDRAMVVQIENGYENLATEMDFVIEHVRNLLTNPSFVPLEEVEVRDDEIVRLREGWERMEARWREAVQMMDGWRKRMARSGQTVNLEELKLGLSLSPLKVEEHGNVLHMSTLVEEGEGDTQADIDAMEESDLAIPPVPDVEEVASDSDSSMFHDDIEEDTFEESSEQQRQQPDVTINTISSLSPGPPPILSPLREIQHGNRGGPSHSKPADFTTIVEENTLDLLNTGKSSSPPKSKTILQSLQKNENWEQLSISTSDEVQLIKASNSHQRSPPHRTSNPSSNSNCTPKLQTNASSRLPRPREHLPPQQSPLTMASIAAKLAATEREADAARVRAKIKAAKLSRANLSSEAAKLLPPSTRTEEESKRATGTENLAIADAGEYDLQGASGAKKRKATGRSQGGRASRRRSTLSPWELESLILGNIVDSPVK